MRVIAALALAGLRHRPLRWALLALGIAVASVLPVVAAGLRLTAQTAAIRAVVDEIPLPQRTVLAVSSQTLEPAQRQLQDDAVRRRFADLGLTAAARVMMYRQLSLAGSTFGLGAADALAVSVRLTSGRLPGTCTPTRCEVLLTSTGSGGQAGLSPAGIAPAAGQLGLVVTGTAELLDERIVGGGLVDADRALLLGGSVEKMSGLAVLELFGRSTAWLSTLSGDSIATAGLDRFRRGLSGLADELNVQIGGLSISWPEDAVASAAARAAGSADRFTVLGAGAAVLQLGFCLFAAVGMRRRQQLVVHLLNRRGASTVQLSLSPVLQAAVVIAAGLVAGALAGTGAVLLLATRTPPGRSPIARAALSDALPTLAWLGLAAVVLTVAVSLWPVDAERATRVALDCLLVASVGLVVLVLGGRAGGQEGTGPLTTSVATVISLAAGLLAARCWPLLVGAFRRFRSPTRGVVWQLAVLGVQRRALAPAVAAGFLAAATCAVVFAGSYSATLRQSAADQAAFQVPLQARVGPSRDVATPLSVLDPVALTALAPGVAIHPLISSSATVFAGTSRAVGLPLTGIDLDAVRGLADFAAVTGSASTAQSLAAGMAAGTAVRAIPAGAGGRPVIPAGATVVQIAAEGMNGDITVALWVVTPEGQERHVPLLAAPGGLRAVLDADRPLQVTGLEIAESASHLVHRQHTTGEGSTDLPLATGDLVLGAAAVDGTPLVWDWSGWGSDTARVSRPAGPAASGSMKAHYQVQDARIVLNPAFLPRQELPLLAVAVDPETAAAAQDGIVPVSLSGLTIRAKIIAVLPRMPTLGPRFLLADRPDVAALLDRAEPGTAVVSQVWIAAPAGALPALRNALGTPPASTAEVRFRVDIERRLAGDPVATRSGLLLDLAGIVALVMAMVAMTLSIGIDRQDSAADHLAWEVDGLAPPAIRRMLFLRVCAVIGLGVPIGAIAGLALTGSAVSLIGVGAGGATTFPPLSVSLGAGWTATMVGLTVLACLAATAVATGAVFREPHPVLPELDLR